MDPPHGDTVDGTQVLPPQASLARVAVEVASPARAAVEDAASPERAAEDQAAAAAPAPAGTTLDGDGTHPLHGTQALRPPQASLARVAVEVASPNRAAVEDAASPARAVEDQVAAAAPAPAGTTLDGDGTHPPHGTQALRPPQASLVRVAVEVASLARAAVEDAASPARAVEDQAAAAA